MRGRGERRRESRFSIYNEKNHTREAVCVALSTFEKMQVDTSESLRNLQQEIESLLAPLTPLPDLEQVKEQRLSATYLICKTH